MKFKSKLLLLFLIKLCLSFKLRIKQDQVSVGKEENSDKKESDTSPKLKVKEENHEIREANDKVRKENSSQDSAKNNLKTDLKNNETRDKSINQTQIATQAQRTNTALSTNQREFGIMSNVSRDAVKVIRPQIAEPKAEITVVNLSKEITKKPVVVGTNVTQQKIVSINNITGQVDQKLIQNTQPIIKIVDEEHEVEKSQTNLVNLKDGKVFVKKLPKVAKHGIDRL